MQNERLRQSGEVDVFSELAEQEYRGENKREEGKIEGVFSPETREFRTEDSGNIMGVADGREVMSEMGREFGAIELTKDGEINEEGMKIVEEVIKKNEDNPYQLSEEIEELSRKVRGR